MHEDCPRWSDALLAAAALATDPFGIRGIVLKARCGPARDAWIAEFARLIGPGVAMRRLPAHATPDRLLGGLDLAATLRAGRPIAERGVLAQADGGVLQIGSSERLPPGNAALIASALDRGEVCLQRDGLTQTSASRFAVVAFDEALADEDQTPVALSERLGLAVSLDALAAAGCGPYDPSDVVRARARLKSVTVSDELVTALDATARQFGVASLNAVYAAMRVARAVAALAGRAEVAHEDAAAAARLVIAPRATVIPAPPAEPEPDEQQPEQSQTEQFSDPTQASLEDMLVQATEAAIPPGLLELIGSVARSGKSGAGGRAGKPVKAVRRGRPSGTRQGAMRGHARLNVIETLRAAAPWQGLRRATASHDALRRIAIRPEDFRINRLKHKPETATIFVVDASGSTAISRLSEAKGAIELLLADCYVRRDQVALIAFGGRGCQLLLPPTRSLTRAKRDLAELPGGGATPLAAGIDAAGMLAESARRKGQTPAIILLTDGRANVARDGVADRSRAMTDAMSAAAGLKARRIAGLLIDTARRPNEEAQRIADAMGVRYLPLPRGDAQTLSHAVRMHAREPAS